MLYVKWKAPEIKWTNASMLQDLRASLIKVAFMEKVGFLYVKKDNNIHVLENIQD